MEAHAQESCNIVYFCASEREDVYELYHKRSPPAAPSDASNGVSGLEQAYHNVRALLDEDQGGFDEGMGTTWDICETVVADDV